jgi:hypothetical protein
VRRPVAQHPRHRAPVRNLEHRATSTSTKQVLVSAP